MLNDKNDYTVLNAGTHFSDDAPITLTDFELGLVLGGNESAVTGTPYVPVNEPGAVKEAAGTVADGAGAGAGMGTILGGTAGGLLGGPAGIIPGAEIGALAGGAVGAAAGFGWEMGEAFHVEINALYEGGVEFLEETMFEISRATQ